MNFIENSTYTLQTDYYNSVKVVCISNADGLVFLEDKSKGSYLLNDNYKLVIKTFKLYKWNDKFKSWDSIENTLSEETVEDVWSKRMGNGSDYYYRIGQD